MNKKPIQPQGLNTVPSGNLEKELTELLNKYNCEKRSDTPDFILAQYLLMCYGAFNVSVERREKWYGREIKESNMNILQKNG